METGEIMIGDEKKLFDAIGNFKIIQLRIAKQATGGGLIEIRGLVDEEKMSLIERILSENNK